MLRVPFGQKKPWTSSTEAQGRPTCRVHTAPRTRFPPAPGDNRPLRQPLADHNLFERAPLQQGKISRSLCSSLSGAGSRTARPGDSLDLVGSYLEVLQHVHVTQWPLERPVRHKILKGYSITAMFRSTVSHHSTTCQSEQRLPSPERAKCEASESTSPLTPESTTATTSTAPAKHHRLGREGRPFLPFAHLMK